MFWARIGNKSGKAFLFMSGECFANVYHHIHSFMTMFPFHRTFAAL